MADNRYTKDSIKSAIKFNKRKDSLQKIIYPIDSLLPFGPKFLGKLVENKTNWLGFKRSDSLSKKEQRNKKGVDSVWKYFNKFNPNEDLDDIYYSEMLLPKTKTYEIIELGFAPLYYNKNFNPKYANFKARISNIGNYEVYFTTNQNTGQLVLYNRKKQHSIVIPVLIFNDDNNYKQFFYIKNNTIYLYEEFFDKEFFGQTSIDRKLIGVVNVNKIYEINILNNDNIIINEQCLKDTITFEEEKLTEEDIKHRNEIEQESARVFKKKRDSLQDYIKPLVANYPFGPKIIKKYQFPSKEYAIKNDKSNPYKNVLDSVIKFDRYMYKIDTVNSNIRFHNYYTLPIVRNIKKINIGGINYWSQGFFNMLQKKAYCKNNKDIGNYKLPSIKNYEVYYSSHDARGILTLYNKNTQNVHVINVLNMINNYYFRFFYINKEQQIEIYQGYKNDIPTAYEKNNIYKITKMHIIEILSDGEIKVIKQK